MYQLALLRLMEEKRFTIKMVSNKGNFSDRWISYILKSSNWNPWLNTLIKLSNVFKIDIIQFLNYAESGKMDYNFRTSDLDITPTKISLALKNVRIERGFSQADLSKLTKFQLSSISLREHGRYQSYPTLGTLEIYCKAYDLSISAFLEIAKKSQ